MNIIIEKRKEKTKLPGVMRAALHLFVKNGIDGTTIKDIAKEASVAEGSLYRHFKSKDDLAWHLFSTHLSQFTSELMSKVFAEEGAQKRIFTFVQESFAAYESDPELNAGKLFSARCQRRPPGPPMPQHGRFGTL